MIGGKRSVIVIKSNGEYIYGKKNIMFLVWENKSSRTRDCLTKHLDTSKFTYEFAYIFFNACMNILYL